jgi:tetratricopeptide (TPR) repeat protein
MTISRTAAAAFMVSAWLAASTASAGQETLSRAKALYTSAAYEEALALLAQLQNGSIGDALEANQYRAFCLLALGRGEEARGVIEQIVQADPAFQPSRAQMSPRLVEAFQEVRRRVLPTMIRQTYAKARSAYDRKELEPARDGFTAVLRLLSDEDAKAAPELSDLGVLSSGFLDLINTAAAPAAQPASASPPAAAAAASAPASAPPPPSAPAPPFFDARNVDVRPPIPISQVIPPWNPRQQPQLRAANGYDGTLTLMVDERGDVTSVTVEGNLQPEYATVLKQVAKGWKYRPAVKDGVAVKYRKTVAIHLNP